MIIYGYVFPKLQVLSNFGKCHKFEFDWHTLKKIVKYAFTWSIMEYYGKQCLRVVNYD
jgi:hypothetical protein